MPNSKDIAWFKRNFGARIKTATAGSVYTEDFIVALACQESGEIWSSLRRYPDLELGDILSLCVGDSLDGNSKPPRRAFPRNMEELLAAPNGRKMFDIARQSLLRMAKYIRGYATVARKESKICHGFGVFQYDLQHFRANPEFFLNEDFSDFDACLKLCLKELESARKRIGHDARTQLDDLDLCAVAIAYNSGGFRPSRGLKQGYKAGSRYYGERIFDFLLLSRTVATEAGAAVSDTRVNGSAILPATPKAAGTGRRHVVITRISALRVRSTPEIIYVGKGNIIAELPEGTVVEEVTGRITNGFIEIVTDLRGAFIRGFCHTAYLREVAGGAQIGLAGAANHLPTSSIAAARMPFRAGMITSRAGAAGAHSLNEPDAPARAGENTEELVRSLGRIIDWLDVENPAHERYRPHGGQTFCNIYAHDYCHLAGVYLPRVWWREKALIALSHGRTIYPKYGSTVFEARANDLLRWLGEFGADFGWRQSGSLTELQQAANQGGIGLIVARRKAEGRSGHISIVAPETEGHSAIRNRAGDVVRPLESQAGARNFKYGYGKIRWWTDARFAESAFFIHG